MLTGWQLLMRKPNVGSISKKRRVFLNNHFETGFRHLGQCELFIAACLIELMNVLCLTVVASYPIIVLIVSLILAAAISAGSVFLVVTINPIEIWAAPNSRCRQEKDFFDETFNPFYRTEQIFFKIVGKSNVSKILIVLRKPLISCIVQIFN